MRQEVGVAVTEDLHRPHFPHYRPVAFDVMGL